MARPKSKTKPDRAKAITNSLANLRPQPALYSEKKKPHAVSVTDTAWKHLKAMASDRNISLSEFIEGIGRGFWEVS